MNKVKYLNDVILYQEAEEIIANLDKIKLEEFGAEKFMKKHAILEKLNMQSLKHALEGGDDFILNFMVDNDKLKDLIEELISSYYFRISIFPKIKQDICEKSNIKAYVVLYHEAVLVNLLENFFFHATACVNAEDYLLDIIDYCYQNLMVVYNKMEKEAKFKGKQLKGNETKEKCSSTFCGKLSTCFPRNREFLLAECKGPMNHIQKGIKSTIPPFQLVFLFGGHHTSH